MPRRERSSVLATLLFVDIVGSTAVAEEMGDRRWRELLGRFHRVLRQHLRDHGGREVDTAGDGVFAQFDSPAAAVRCACAAADGVRQLGVEIRAGVHIGDCEILDGKPSGVNVHVASRAMSHAGAADVVVTAGVRDLVRGAGFGFDDRGVHELRGVAGEWQLFAVTSVDGDLRASAAPEQEARERRDAITPPPIVKRRRIRVLVAAAAAVLLAAGGSLALAHALRGSDALIGCQVTQTKQLKDRWFNEGVYNGLTDAGTRLDMVVRTYVSPQAAEPAWREKLETAVAEGCDVLVTVGDPMLDTTAAVARRHPDRRFIVSDTVRNPGLPNVRTIRFRPNDAAFTAGYLAAGMTRTGKIGTFGGIPSKDIVGFMDGFTGGVRAYNERHGQTARVLGWEPSTRHGLFVGADSGNHSVEDPQNIAAFGNRVGAERIASGLLRGGADVLFAVDGPTGELAIGTAAGSRAGVTLIGVDGDQYFVTPEFSNRWLTSVQKNYGAMVDLAVGNAVEDDVRSGVLVGTLANGGVGLAPYHSMARRVPQRLRGELDEIERGIVNGSISTG